MTEFGEQHLAPAVWRENRQRIYRAASRWLLLLQIDCRDYLQQLAEGTVYFLIRRDDLAARAFDKVLAVYQQT